MNLNPFPFRRKPDGTGLPESERALFAKQVAGKLNEYEPIIGVNGDTSDFMSHEGRLDVSHTLLQEMVSPEEAKDKKYDLVLVYNPASGKITFGDEVLGWGEDDLYMREDFQKLKQEINIVAASSLSDGNQSDLVTPLVEKAFVGSTHGMMPDKVCLELVSQLIGKGKKVCLVVEQAHHFIPSNGDQMASPERVSNEALVLDLVRGDFRRNPGSHIILIDRKNKLNGDITEHIPFVSIPPTNEADVHPILSGTIKDPEEMKKALVLARRTRIRDLMNLTTEFKDDPKNLLERLVRFKEEQVVKMAGGAVKCRIEKYDESMVAMPDEELEFWNGVAKSMIEKPDTTPQGALLMGSPGVGKSVRARYMASLLGMPFLQVKNTSSGGLRGVKEDRVTAVLEAAIRVKPCVIFWDEIDKAFPRTEGMIEGFSSNDDEEVAAKLQTMLDSEEMQGVIFVAGVNNPETMNEALLRSGRFGIKIACLVPKTDKERMDVFKAVWNQLPSAREINMPTKAILQLVAQASDQATGADYKELIQNAIRDLDVGKYSDINQAIIYHLSVFRFAKNDRFRAMEDKALEMHSAPFLLDGESIEISENFQEILGALQIIEDGKAQLDEKEALIDQKIEQLGVKSAQVEASKLELNELIEQHAQVMLSADADLQDRRNRLDTEIAQKRKELDDEEQALADLRQTLEDELASMGEKVSERVNELLIEERAKLAEIQLELNDIEAGLGFRSAELENRATSLDELNALIQQRERELADFKNTLNALEATIKALQKELENKLKGAIGEHEAARLREMLEAVEAQKKELAEKRQAEAAKEREFRNLQMRQAGYITSVGQIPRLVQKAFFELFFKVIKDIRQFADKMGQQGGAMIQEHLNREFADKSLLPNNNDGSKVSILILKVKKNSAEDMEITGDVIFDLGFYVPSILRNDLNLLKGKDGRKNNWTITANGRQGGGTRLAIKGLRLDQEVLSGSGDLIHMLGKLGQYHEAYSGKIHYKPEFDVHAVVGELVEFKPSMLLLDYEFVTKMTERIIASQFAPWEHKKSSKFKVETTADREEVANLFAELIRVLRDGEKQLEDLIIFLGEAEAERWISQVSTLAEYKDLLSRIVHIKNQYLHLSEYGITSLSDKACYERMHKMLIDSLPSDEKAIEIDSSNSRVKILRKGQGIKHTYYSFHNTYYTELEITPKPTGLSISADKRELDMNQERLARLASYINGVRKDGLPTRVRNGEISLGLEKDKLRSVYDEFYKQLGVKFPAKYVVDKKGETIHVELRSDRTPVSFKLEMQDNCIRIFDYDFSRCSDQSEATKRRVIGEVIHTDLRSVFTPILEEVWGRVSSK